MKTEHICKRHNSVTTIIVAIAFIAALVVAVVKGRGAEVAMPSLAECDYGKLPGKEDAATEKLYGAGRLFLGGAGTFRLQDISDTSDIRGSGGVALQGGYHIVDNVAIVGEGATENTGHSVFDSAALGLQAYIPVADSGLAPYGKVLGGRQFEGEENWFVAGEGGLEVRGKRFGAFAGIRYQYDLKEQSDLMPVLGFHGHFGTK